MAVSTVLTDATRQPAPSLVSRGPATPSPGAKAGPPVIVVSHLSKTYPNGVKALDDISLTVPRGQIFGLLGPNGAGKSSLIRILCGTAVPSAGSARVCGMDPAVRPREVRETLCGLLQGAPLEANARVSEVLWLFSKFYRQPADPEALLARLGLTEARHSLCKTLSGGQQQRLAIARALIGNPRVLILDEPSTGLDVAARHELMQIVNQLRAEGRTILLSTHNLDEAETWCDQVAIISRGRLFAVDTPSAIIAQHGIGDRLEILLGQPMPLEQVRCLPGVLEAKALQATGAEADRSYLLQGANAEDMLREVMRALIAADVPLDRARPIRDRLEAAYLNLTGERIRS